MKTGQMVRAIVNVFFGVAVLVLLLIDYITKTTEWAKLETSPELGMNPLRSGPSGGDADDWSETDCSDASGDAETYCNNSQRAFTGSFVTGIVYGLVLLFHGGKRGFDSQFNSSDDQKSKRFYKYMAMFAVVMNILTIIMAAITWHQFYAFVDEQVSSDIDYTIEGPFWMWTTASLWIPAAWLLVVAAHLIMNRETGIEENLETLARLL